MTTTTKKIKATESHEKHFEVWSYEVPETWTEDDIRKALDNGELSGELVDSGSASITVTWIEA